jgi:hypothetical protein
MPGAVYSSPLPQKSRRRANCIRRGLRVLLNCPRIACVCGFDCVFAFAKVAILSTPLNSEWLKVLYVSTRSCSLKFPFRGMFLNRAVSKFVSPGRKNWTVGAKTPLPVE